MTTKIEILSKTEITEYQIVEKTGEWSENYTVKIERDSNSVIRNFSTCSCDEYHKSLIQSRLIVAPSCRHIRHVLNK